MKTCQAKIEPFNLKSETRFGQEHVKILGPEMMMMKRTKSKRKVKDTAFQSGKPPKHDLVVVKVTDGSPNYMKGTSSSEARKENKKRLNLFKNQKNQTGLKHDSPSSKIVKCLRTAPSFKRCSQKTTNLRLQNPSQISRKLAVVHHKATCSSTLKDSKFSDFLMLNHDGTEAKGTSVLKVCPYTYCSLNGHAQYPPLKSFISSRRRSLKSQKNAKMEASKEEHGNGETFEIEIDTQISETVSEGAPRAETDSDGYSDTEPVLNRARSPKLPNQPCLDSVEMVKFSEDDHEINLQDSVKEIQETCEVDVLTEIAETDIEEAPCSETDSDHEIYLQEFDLKENLVEESVKESVQEHGEADQTGCFISEVIGMLYTIEDKESCIEDFENRIEENVSEIKELAYAELNQEESNSTITWTIKSKKPIGETENSKDFNPREPNYLPVIADADNEKVNLKHQDMDERKNSEDWMVDYALQRVVTELSSAKKRKVALLVEAFETVKPIRESAQVQVCS